MMHDDLLTLYRNYRDSGDLHSGDQIARQMYSILSQWLHNGAPEHSFIDEFWRLFAEIDEISLVGTNLIDLGLMQTAEALSVFKENEDPSSATTFYLKEALLPFLAFIDEQSYRKVKNIDFSEIDFQIFEIIGGEFPHDAAQNFLMQNEWSDIWIALRYLDSLDDRQLRFEIIEQMIFIRETIQEKLIFLSYLLLSDATSLLDRYTEYEENNAVRSGDLNARLIFSIYRVIKPFLESGTLDTAWESRVAPEYERQIVFVLLALFEINQSPLSAGWVHLFEKGVSTLWNAPIHGSPGKYIPQPIQEFAGSILALFPETEILTLLETSLIIPLFIENLHRYTEESFHDLLGAVSKAPEQLLIEIELNLYRYKSNGREKKRFDRRLKKCAERIGYDLTMQNGNAQLIKKESR